MLSETTMKIKFTLAFAALALTLAAGQSHAAGCLKGAAVGGVGGHFVGSGHAVLGAAGGCLVGRHMANKKAKEDAAARKNTQVAHQPAPGG
jgi:outer membrane lipoprotein SlyB